MTFVCRIPYKYIIPLTRVGNPRFVDNRIKRTVKKGKGPTAPVLRYLYLSDGRTNLRRDQLRPAEDYLEVREKLAARWLTTRTNGRLRKYYGKAALLAVRRSKYRCEKCSCPDVRVLQIDHVHGRGRNDEFACLCANCHAIKSRKADWNRG
jgi:hypothetical protein